MLVQMDDQMRELWQIELDITKDALLINEFAIKLEVRRKHVTLHCYGIEHKKELTTTTQQVWK